MNFVFGRNNLALTVFVPYDCDNNCAFCTSKINYTLSRPSEKDVIYQMKRIFEKYNFPITDVVFTGGEPTANIETLSELIDLVPDDKHIFINTTLPETNLLKFSKLVNENDKVCAVNISRHEETYVEDAALMNGICYDEQLDVIKKPIRINCVIKKQNLSRILIRWSKYPHEISFRKDFNIRTTQEQLHSPYDKTALFLIENGFKFKSHTQCNVCDTTIFERAGQMVQYHKGTKKTSIRRGDTIEINDLIIFQDGRFGYDWEGNSLEVKDELLCQFQKPVIPTYPTFHPLSWQNLSFSSYPCSSTTASGSRCGGGGCGIHSCGGGCGGPIVGNCG